MTSEVPCVAVGDDRRPEPGNLIDLDRLRVEPGHRLKLDERDPRESFGLDKDSAKAATSYWVRRLGELQTLVHAGDKNAVLVVLQAMDAGGKDGTIRSVFVEMDPLGVRSVPFGVPAGRETEQDYLWRVHHQCPGRGEIVIFNRSHYEDVLVVRVKGLVPEDRWRRRYEHIRNFERMLTDEGTTIVKFFLNVSNAEQRERLQDRIDDPMERWKFRSGDLDDRAMWPEFMEAYTDAISETSTKNAPWYVIPADRKWVRNLAVSTVMVNVLESLDLRLPDPEPGIEALTVT
jgi:PPK2 family polyphosphate:nucleotide phosphotransferase